ncbi:hypothetical protein B0H19DRAFT_1088118 [Mycena capillaripes]|nr:hypothetical protein B0H19DRAFT_1088118 [Mycena capillaripes]
MIPKPIASISEISSRILRFSRTRALPPQCILPIELWEIIFQEILLHKALLRISTVCKVFNVLCIRILFARNHYSDELFSSQNLHVPSQILSAFHLSFRPFAFERFATDMGPLYLCRDLKFLRDILSRSEHLRELALTFRTDLFRIPDESSMAAFRALLSTMVKRVPGPVIIVFPGNIISCRPEDVAHWQLHLFQFNRALGPRGFIMRARHAFGVKVKRPSWYFRHTKIRFHDGKIYSVPALTKLHSATLKSINQGSEPFPSFTLLTFDASSITVLALGRTAHKSISGRHLSVAMVHILLPALHTLGIHIDTIDPAVLGHFLMDHPTLKVFEYGGWREELEPRPLVHPPIAHPGLSRIQCVTFGKRTLGRAIIGLDTSPGLNEFSFTFDIFPLPPNMAGLILDLGRISLRRIDQDTMLRLTMWDHTKKEEGRVFWASSTEACDVAKELHCVRSVELTCWSVDLAIRMLPWLTLLPAVSAVSFSLHLKRYRSHPQPDEELATELARCLAQANIALPHVPNVTGRVC